MEQQESTNSVPEQRQSQDASALETQEQPKAVHSDIEPARKCQICGSPNHHACGCEARARKENTGFTAVPDPEVEKEVDVAEQILNNPFVAEARELGIKQSSNIQILADSCEGVKACMYDMVQYLKAISEDVIKIRQLLEKHDKQPENTDVEKTE